MPKLIKNAVSTYIPGDPGEPGSPYVPAQPARTVVETRTVCTNGYETVIIVDEDGTPYFFLQSIDPVCTTENVLVYYPATAAVPAVPYAAPTPAQISLSMNEGWNSHARSLDTLDSGSLVEFSVKPGSYGALVAIGAPGMEGLPIDAFGHGIMVDAAGIYAFESGVVVEQLATGNVSGLMLRIHRLADGRIAYIVGGVATLSATPVGVFDTLHVYGMLYAAYDEVSSTEFIAVPAGIAEIDVLMSGSGDFRVSMNGPAVLMSGSGSFTMLPEVGAVMSGAGAFVATLDAGGNGSVTLEAMQAFGSDADSHAYGSGDTSLPLFTASGYGGAFIPTAPTSGYVNLPFIVAWGDGVEISAGNGDVSLPLFLAQASEGEYGIGNVSLPLFRTFAYGGFQDDDELVLMSAGVARSQQTQVIDLVMVLNSSGELTSTLSMTREQALELMSMLQQSDSFAMLGVYAYSMLSSANVASLQNAGIGSLPDLDGSSAVWVVNIDTQASSQYDNYGFNSFIKRNGVCYGVAPDGIYRLDGATDAGVQVDALAYLGRLDFATALQKLLPNAYLGASSTDKLQLEVDADGTLYVYETRSSEDGTFRSHRVDLGRGLKANMLGLTVSNKGGADFKLATVDILQAPGGRRI